ncbi:dTMP kinase [Streptomyces sp. NPDC057565]|uniref:dTMP kinase n=1 Tax=Streptomyces sp. NPDC057565 TaxID=3346169 RepID=UPI0036765082
MSAPGRSIPPSSPASKSSPLGTALATIRDRDYLLDRAGVIFKGIGDVHPGTHFLGYVKYYPDARGDRVLFGRTYRQNSVVSKAFGILADRPECYLYSPAVGCVITGVPREDIVTHYSCRQTLAALHQTPALLGQTEVSEDLLTIINWIVAAGAADVIGVTGSFLVGACNARAAPAQPEDPGGCVMTLERGRFVTLDGPSGVGKSTTIQALRDELFNRGIAVRQTLEPTTRDIGRFISAHFSHIRSHALACLVAADRYEHVEHEIEPWLSAGDTVVTDRYLASTLVMQQLDGVPLKFLLDLNAHVLMPDLAVILTAHPSLIAERIAARGPRNRFHHDPTVPGREVDLYDETAQTLMTANVKVLVANTSDATPSEATATIADAIPESPVASAA